MDTGAFGAVHKVLKALSCCVSRVRALLRFFHSYKCTLPTSLPLCLLISKGDCAAPQPAGLVAAMFHWHAEAYAIPAAFDILTPVFSFFIFPRIALFQSYFTTPVATLSCAEASKAFLKSRVNHAHSFHLPVSLITSRADDSLHHAVSPGW